MGRDEGEGMWVMYLCPDQLADFFPPRLSLSLSFFFIHSGGFLHQVEGKAAFCHETLCAV